jgi:hypothetical protein
VSKLSTCALLIELELKGSDDSINLIESVLDFEVSIAHWHAQFEHKSIEFIEDHYYIKACSQCFLDGTLSLDSDSLNAINHQEHSI